MDMRDIFYLGPFFDMATTVLRLPYVQLCLPALLANHKGFTKDNVCFTLVRVYLK